MKSIRDWFRAAREAPCDPLPPPDPYKGVVGGPELVVRTAHNKATHDARYLADNAHGEFPISAWGPFDPSQLGHSYPQDVFADPVEAP